MLSNRTRSADPHRRLPESPAGPGTQRRDPQRRPFQPDSPGAQPEEELVVAYTWPEAGGWRVY